MRRPVMVACLALVLVSCVGDIGGATDCDRLLGRVEDLQDQYRIALDQAETDREIRDAKRRYEDRIVDAEQAVQEAGC